MARVSSDSIMRTSGNSLIALRTFFTMVWLTNPLFDIPQLLKLAKGVIDRGDPTKFGLTVAEDAKFNDAPWQVSLPEAIRHVEEGGFGSSYLALRNWTGIMTTSSARRLARLKT